MSKHLKRNLLFLSAVAIALTGLGIIATKTKAQSQSTAGCPQCFTPRKTGFYRYFKDPKVYYLDSATRTRCHVQNPSQMEAFGGFGLVRVFKSSFSPETQFIGKCAWPDGFFRRSNLPHVYKLFDTKRSYCHVTDPQQMERFGGFSKVRVVSPDSSLEQGRSNLGSCSG